MEAIFAVLDESPTQGRFHYVDLAGAIATRWTDSFGPTERRMTPHFTVWRTLNESEDFETLGKGWFNRRSWGTPDAGEALNLTKDGGAWLRTEAKKLRAATSGKGSAADSASPILGDDERRMEEVGRRTAALDAARALLDQGEVGASELREVMKLWSTSGGKNPGVTLHNRFAPAFVGQFVHAFVEQIDTFNEWVQDLLTAPMDSVPEVLDQLWARRDLRLAGTLLPTMVLHTRDPETWFPWTSGLAKGLAAAKSNPAGATRADASSDGYAAYCTGVQEFIEERGFSPHLADMALAEEASRASVPRRGKKASNRRFSEETFALLTDIRDTPAVDAEWFAPHKSAYYEHVRHPLEHLVALVASEVVDPLLNAEGSLGEGVIVTERKLVMAKIIRQAAFSDGSRYFPYLWAAFFPAEQGKKYKAAQLFLEVFADRFEVGVAVHGAQAATKSRISKLARKGHTRLAGHLAQLKRPLLLRRGSSETGQIQEERKVAWVADLAALGASDGDWALAFSYTPEEAQDEGFSAGVVEACRQMLPFYAVAVTDDLDTVLDHLGIGGGEDAGPEEEEEEEFSLDALVAHTHLEKKWLERVARAATYGTGRGQLGQVVLYGPPGTGKTFVAEQIGLHLVDGDPDRFHLIQLHPAYSYEHFVEGYRPRLSSSSGDVGQLVWEVAPGKLRAVVEAVQKSQKRHVIIIDEMNRGDVPQVFGELMFLLSRRGTGAGVTLARSGQTLRLPNKLSIIGTMNTADRSIAHVDFALRRRFRFFALDPDARILQDYRLDAYGDADGPLSGALGQLLNYVNDRLRQAAGGAALQVGHSYFMDVSNLSQLAEVWTSEVQPLLEDYFGYDPTRLDRLRWDQVRGLVKEWMDPPNEEESNPDGGGEAQPRE